MLCAGVALFGNVVCRQALCGQCSKMTTGLCPCAHWPCQPATAGPPVPIKANASRGLVPQAPAGELGKKEERLVTEGTGCYDAAEVQRALQHCRGNVDEVGFSEILQGALASVGCGFTVWTA